MLMGDQFDRLWDGMEHLDPPSLLWQPRDRLSFDWLLDLDTNPTLLSPTTIINKTDNSPRRSISISTTQMREDRLPVLLMVLVRERPHNFG
jgi:hypothetical protein